MADRAANPDATDLGDASTRRIARGPLHRVLALGLIASVLLVGCDRAGGTGETVKQLRIGVLPDESAPTLDRRLQRVRVHIEEATGVPCALVLPDSYEALLNGFVRGEIDIAYLGGCTFCPLRPMARESWSSGTITSIDCSPSSMITLETWAGDSALHT